MKFVKDIDDIIDNLEMLESYLKSSNKEELAFAQDLVQNAETILVYKIDGQNHFAPVRFCSYLGVTMKDYLAHEGNDEREMNGALEKILKGKAWFLQKKEEEYVAYCVTLGLQVAKNERAYWRVGTTSDPYMDIRG
jgi:hypothetical protein|tara:strand:+ start:164 stop:571 length:408 start_codon:yes stop_codon:yes gene_type:complete